MSTQNIYFDFEFMDDGQTITPISVGMCADTDKELYLEYHFDPARASEWVRENVFPNLDGVVGAGFDRWLAGQEIEKWVDEICQDCDGPRFWSLNPAYRWVCLVQHYGPLVMLPESWPYRPACLGQHAAQLGVEKPTFLATPKRHALSRAKWNRDLYRYIEAATTQAALDFSKRGVFAAAIRLNGGEPLKV